MGSLITSITSVEVGAVMQGQGQLAVGTVENVALSYRCITKGLLVSSCMILLNVYYCNISFMHYNNTLCIVPTTRYLYSPHNYKWFCLR